MELKYEEYGNFGFNQLRKSKGVDIMCWHDEFKLKNKDTIKWKKGFEKLIMEEIYWAAKLRSNRYDYVRVMVIDIYQNIPGARNIFREKILHMR